MDAVAEKKPEPEKKKAQAGGKKAEADGAADSKEKA